MTLLVLPLFCCYHYCCFLGLLVFPVASCCSRLFTVVAVVVVAVVAAADAVAAAKFKLFYKSNKLFIKL